MGDIVSKLMLVSRSHLEWALDGNTTNKKCMMKSAGSAIQHAQTTGAELTKLISYYLWIGMLGSGMPSLH
jgi:hypothetical protein